jgi:hypothetical protein
MTSMGYRAVTSPLPPRLAQLLDSVRELATDSLGTADETALSFALAHADAVDVSFVNSAADVRRIGERIRTSGKPGFGMILKPGTRAAIGGGRKRRVAAPLRPRPAPIEPRLKTSAPKPRRRPARLVPIPARPPRTTVRRHEPSVPEPASEAPVSAPDEPGP